MKICIQMERGVMDFFLKKNRAENMNALDARAREWAWRRTREEEGRDKWLGCKRKRVVTGKANIKEWHRTSIVV